MNRFINLVFHFVITDVPLAIRDRNVTNVNGIQDAFMGHAINRGNAIARKAGAVCFAIKT